MNAHAVRAIYRFEMARTFRTVVQSILTPVLTTSLYFVVFGSAIGSRMTEIGGVPFAAFIVPGLIMLSVLNESIGNASFGIYFPKWSGTIFELLSAPVGDAGNRAGLCGRGGHQVRDDRLDHPGHFGASSCRCRSCIRSWMLVFLVLTALTFSLFGFVLGIWATSWEKLQFVPALIITPLTFLGGSFYSIDMLPPVWRAITLFNPVVYLISGFRWSFYGHSDVNPLVSFGLVVLIMSACLALISWMIRTGWRLRH